MFFILLLFFIPGQSSKESQHGLNFWILTMCWKRRTKTRLRRCLSPICFPDFWGKINISRSKDKETTKAKMLWSAGTASLNRHRAHGQGKHSPGKMFPDYTSRTVHADQTPPISYLFSELIRWTGASGCVSTSRRQCLQQHVVLFVQHSTDTLTLWAGHFTVKYAPWLLAYQALWLTRRFPPASTAASRFSCWFSRSF